MVTTEAVDGLEWQLPRHPKFIQRNAHHMALGTCIPSPTPIPAVESATIWHEFALTVSFLFLCRQSETQINNRCLRKHSVFAKDNVAFVRRTNGVRSQMNEFRDFENGSRGNYSLAVCLTVRWTRVARGYGSRSVTFWSIVRPRIWKPSNAAACTTAFWAIVTTWENNFHHRTIRVATRWQFPAIITKHLRSCQPYLKIHLNTRLELKIRPTWRKFSKSQQNTLTAALMMKRHQLRSKSQN